MAPPPDSELNSSAVLEELATDPGRSVIASVHELKGAYADGDRDRAMALLARADEIIAVSRAVAADIAACDPLLADKTEMIHGCIPTRQAVVDDPVRGTDQLPQSRVFADDVGIGHPIAGARGGFSEFGDVGQPACLLQHTLSLQTV